MEHFRISEPYSESKNSFFIELAKTLPPPKEFEKLTQEEIIKLQPKSTQKMMLMTDDEHKAFHETPISTEGQTTLADISFFADQSINDKEKQAKIGAREVSVEEFIIHDQYRKASKNTQHQFTEGHGNLKANGNSSITPETKQKAIDSFVYSPSVLPERIDPKSITGLAPIKSEPFQLPVKEAPKFFLGCSFGDNKVYLFGIRIY